MDRDEAGALFDAAALSLPGPLIDRLCDRTEGWPVGLYLATLAIGEQDDLEAAAAAFAGDDRLVVDYVREELLSALPRRTREFLLQASVLDELGAPVCDAVLERSDSARVLADTAQSLQLLIPLDRRGAAYRMHQLMRETLRAELARREPELERQLHERAATWYEAVGDHDRAVEHLWRAGDRERLEAVIWSATPIFAGIGLTATVERWLEAIHERRDRGSPGVDHRQGVVRAHRRRHAVVAVLGDRRDRDGRRRRAARR